VLERSVWASDSGFPGAVVRPVSSIAIAIARSGPEASACWSCDEPTAPRSMPRRAATVMELLRNDCSASWLAVPSISTHYNRVFDFVDRIVAYVRRPGWIRASRKTVGQCEPGTKVPGRLAGSGIMRSLMMPVDCPGHVDVRALHVVLSQQKGPDSRRLSDPARLAIWATGCRFRVSSRRGRRTSPSASALSGIGHQGHVQGGGRGLSRLQDVRTGRSMR